MHLTTYRIIDSVTGEPLTQGLTVAQAHERLEIMELEYPHIDLEIELDVPR